MRMVVMEQANDNDNVIVINGYKFECISDRVTEAIISLCKNGVTVSCKYAVEEVEVVGGKKGFRIKETSFSKSEAHRTGNQQIASACQKAGMKKSCFKAGDKEYPAYIFSSKAAAEKVMATLESSVRF